MKYWLMKSEPSTFSFDDLLALPKQTDGWEGVRNYQARNFMRDDMKVGDETFFYHSNCKVPAIVGIAKIVKESYPDDTAFDPDSNYFDPKSTTDNPRWFQVDVKAVRTLAEPISLSALKQNPALESLPLVQKGSRLSILPVSKKEWQAILKMETCNESR